MALPAGSRWSPRPEREVALELLPEALRVGEAVVCEGYAGEEFAERVGDLGGFTAAQGSGLRRSPRGSQIQGSNRDCRNCSIRFSSRKTQASPSVVASTSSESSLARSSAGSNTSVRSSEAIVIDPGSMADDPSS